MNLQQLIFTENACYKAGVLISPKGIVFHSTGANNPWLKRYVGPDDGKLGHNRYNNHWNQAMSRRVCAHAFIGKLADGSIATYQTLPWTMRGWHAGGTANDTHIGFEVCEDGLTDPEYFAQVYAEAVQFGVYLCQRFGLDPLKDGVILGHNEAHIRGMASNHADPEHWMRRHGTSMADYRNDVNELLKPTRIESKEEQMDREIAERIEATADRIEAATARLETLAGAAPKPAPAPAQKPSKTILEIAREVIAGKWGNGDDRKRKLQAAGYSAAEVQAMVNKLV